MKRCVPSLQVCPGLSVQLDVLVQACLGAELCSPSSESSSRPRKKTFVSSLGLLLGSKPTTDGLGSVGSTVPCGRPAGSSDTSGLS